MTIQLPALVAQNKFFLSGARKRFSRRQLFAIGGGGIATLGLGSVIFWQNWQGQHTPRLIHTMTAEIVAVAWAPDSNSFAIREKTGVITAWAIGGQQIYSQLASGEDILPLSMAWSPDGKYLAVGGGSEMSIWNAQNGKQLASFPDIVDNALVWSPDGKRIASSSDLGEIHIWEARNGHIQHTLQVYKGTGNGSIQATSLAWSPDGLFLAALGPQVGDFLALWNTTTGEATVLPFNESFNGMIGDIITALAWSPDGTCIVAGYQSPDENKGRVAFWSRQGQTGTWSYNGSIPAHFWIVSEVAWAPDSTRFVTIGQDNEIHIWSAASKMLLNTSTCTDPDTHLHKSLHVYALQALGWSPSGKYLLIGDNAGQVWLWTVG